MNLFNKLKLHQLHRMISNLTSGNQLPAWPHKRPDTHSEVAHFCEHDGIFIRFTRARATWHAMAPCALKPWWLFLNPLKKIATEKFAAKKYAREKLKRPKNLKRKVRTP